MAWGVVLGLGRGLLLSKMKMKSTSDWQVTGKGLANDSEGGIKSAGRCRI
jgi:hypothetical protein